MNAPTCVRLALSTLLPLALGCGKTALTAVDDVAVAPVEVAGADSGTLPPVDAGVDAAPDAAPPDVPDVAGPAYHVLFLGNSYTYVNDLPAMVKQFATNGGARVDTDSVTQGGAYLSELFALPAVTAALAKPGWTHVVLQGQSLEPVWSSGGFGTGAKSLADAVKKAGAAVAFYTTWPRKAGDSVYTNATSGGTPAALAAKLEAAYQTVADANGGVRVHVGDAWMRVLTEHPEIAMYQDDGSHPLPNGTYLAACVFSATLFAVDPTKVTWIADGVSAKDASTLRAVCAEATK